MKAKRLSLALAALLAAGGLWLARSAWRPRASDKSSTVAASKTSREQSSTRNGQTHANEGDATGMSQSRQAQPSNGRPEPDQMLNPPAPPVPNRRFTDFTPEERVKFARQGHGPGG
jgi:hypothetical protein